MSEFYCDHLTGSGDLSGHIPDTGSAPTAPTVDIGDGSWVQSAGDNLLTAVVLDGAGAAQIDDSIATNDTVILKLPTPPSADFFIEMTLRTSPDVDSLVIYLLGRTSAEAANPPDGVNAIGGAFELNNDPAQVTQWQSLEGSSGFEGTPGSGAYPAGPYDIVIRAEWEGAVLRLYLDGVEVVNNAITDSEFLAAGEAYIIINPGSYTANLSDALILDICAGTFDAGIFWTAYLRTTEVDS